MKFVLVLLVVLVNTSFAALRGQVHKGYAGYDPLPSLKRSAIQNEEITLNIALKQRNVDKLEDMFWAVSNPHSPSYGRHLGLPQMIDLVAPTSESTEVVLKWLISNGVKEDNVELVGSNDFLKVHTTVGMAEQMFQSHMTAYMSKRHGGVVASFDEGYLIPDSVSTHVDFVSHFNHLKNAPRFMSESVEAERNEPPAVAPVAKHTPETREGFERNDFHASAVSANAPPIVGIYTMNGGFILTGFIIYCMNGSNFPLDSFLCGDESEYLLGTQVVVTSNVTGEILANFSYNAREMLCKLCKYDPTCKLTSYAKDAALCNAVDGKYQLLPNYHPFTVSINNVWYYNSSFNTSGPYDPANDAVLRGDWYTSIVLEGCDDASPSVISRTYSIPNGSVVKQSKNSQAVVEFAEDFMLSDATLFFNNYGLPDMVNLIKIVNPQYVNLSRPGGGEGILDITCIMGTAPNCTTYYWASSPYQSDPYYTWIVDVLNSPNPPYVHSVSWGSPEIDPFFSDSSYLSRSNIEFMKAGVRGLSILVSSGDAGAQWYINSSYPLYSPNYPASSPYVTTVGATVLASAPHSPACYQNDGKYNCSLVEKVCSMNVGSVITSGGGFSNRYGRPSYQENAVSSYLPLISQAQVAAGVNKSGRGFPDISALGHNYPVFHNGKMSYADGTSASAPVIAGMVTLLNDIRFSQGKSPLGFLNPLLYSLDSSFFHDVTLGDTFCVRTGCVVNGFNSAPGWDAATGLGTPNFTKLAAYVSTLPDTTTTTTTTSTASTTSPSSTTTSQSTSPSTTSEASTIGVCAALLVVIFAAYL